MEKKLGRCSKRITLVLVPLLLAAGCGDIGDGGVRRDVYAKFEDCIADWGEKDLCLKLGERERQDLAAATGGPHGPASNAMYYFYGPTYDPLYRSVDYGGRTIAPQSSRALSNLNMPRHASFARSPGSPGKVAGSGSVSRGGLGASGARASASSSS